MRATFFNLFFYAFTFCAAIPAWALAKFGARRALRRYVGWWARRVIGAVRLILGGRIEVLGRERLPEGGPQLLIAKHQSELDAILLFALHPEMVAIVMKELERYPFIGAIVTSLEFVAVSVTQGSQGRTQQVIDGARRALSEGRPVLIYPEGTLMSLGARERYRAGAWRIYAATSAVATPVAQSLGAIWPRREWRKHIGRTGALEFLPPMPPALDQTDFMEMLEERVEAASMDLIRKHADGRDLVLAEDRFARRAANED